MKTTRLNQSGMSSILFAMVFIVLLSLLAVGFLRLVRDDQRQVLDKSLSYQAQYGAEAAINKKQAELQANPAAAAQPACNTYDLGAVVGGGVNVKVTCLTWNNEVGYLTKSKLDSSSFVSVLEPKSGPFTAVTITWNSDTSTTTYAAPGGVLPAISNSNKPILRLVIADSGNIPAAKTAYIVPSNTNSNSFGAGWANATVGSVSCSGAGDCSVTLAFNSSKAYISLAALGGIANVKSVAVTAPDPTLKGAQAEIDANARAQDVTKRIIARVSLTNETWNPGFAVSAAKVCKDFRVDGAQDKSASEPGVAAACPN